MSEKYFVVSADELDELKLSGYRLGLNNDQDWAWYELDQAEAACRARPVRFIGAADQGNSLMLWGEVKE